MSWEFYNETYPVARKEHICEHCYEPIVVGEKHFHYWGKCNGQMQTTRLHLECKEPFDLICGDDPDNFVDTDKYVRGSSDTAAEARNKEEVG